MEKDFSEAYRIPFEEQDKWRKHLSQEGFVVIANWLGKENCQKYLAQFWDIMEHMADGSLDRHKPETQILSKNYPPVLHGGMIQYIGHSRPQWELRKLSKPLFSKLWGTNDLKSSFDGFCFMNGMRNYQKVAQNSFLHCDQSPTKNKVWSYQGVLSLTESGSEGGGFVVVPKSNNYHHRYFQEKKMLDYKKNWYLVPEEDKQAQPLCNHIKVNTQAGDYVIFDSRTFHCNTVPTNKVLRVCVYICMLPTSHIAEKTLVVRKLAAKNRRTSNHHSGDGFRTFPELPRFLADRQRFQELLKDINQWQFDEEIDQLI